MSDRGDGERESEGGGGVGSDDQRRDRGQEVGKRTAGGVDGSGDAATYRDAADRLRRVIDAQVETLREIDDRAVSLLRLVAALLTALASAAGVAASLAGSLPPVNRPAAVAAGLAALGLLTCTVASAVTYLGSRFVPGLGPAVGEELSEGSPPAPAEHLRRVLAAQAAAIRRNRAALAANARRFRVAVAGLLAGVGYGTLAVGLALAGAGPTAGWTALAAATALVAAVWWHLLTGRDLAVPDGERTVGGPVTSPARLASSGTRIDPYPLQTVVRGGRPDGERERRNGDRSERDPGDAGE